MRRRPTTVRIARWSATHPWRAMLGWLVFVVLCVTAAASSARARPRRPTSRPGSWAGRSASSTAVSSTTRHRERPHHLPGGRA
jgi:RND superfamily putative drug exporter